MAEQMMELRGIPISHLVDYLLECGGRKLTDSLPIQIDGERWQAEIVREESVQITSLFHVNAVFIRFTALSEHDLNELLARFRIKVLRVGG